MIGSSNPCPRCSLAAYRGTGALSVRLGIGIGNGLFARGGGKVGGGGGGRRIADSGIGNTSVSLGTPAGLAAEALPKSTDSSATAIVGSSTVADTSARVLSSVGTGRSARRAWRSQRWHCRIPRRRLGGHQRLHPQLLRNQRSAHPSRRTRCLGVLMNRRRRPKRPRLRPMTSEGKGRHASQLFLSPLVSARSWAPTLAGILAADRPHTEVPIMLLARAVPPVG